MNGMLIQQITPIELELLIRRIVREEVLALNSANSTSKPIESLDDILLSKNEAAKLLKISLPTFSKMIKEGKVRTYRIGKRFKFKKNQILSAISLK